MEHWKDIARRGLVAILFLGALASADAQVMWNLKGGWMSRDVIMSESGSVSDIEERPRPDWMVGLELEIPVSEKLNLETGLRYKNHYTLVNTLCDYGSFTEEQFEEAKTIFELPLRLTYKQQLGRHFSLHAGIGPYVSAIADGWESKKWRETKWSDFVHVGLEPSVAINWACLSLGVTYNTPCFYKGYKDENKPVVMATLGIRFKSKAWKYVGASLLTIGTIGIAAASAWQSANEANYNSYGASDGHSSSAGVSHRSSHSTTSEMSGTDQQNYNTLRNLYRQWADKLNAMRDHNYPYQNGYTEAQKKEAQQQMKQLRQMAKEKWDKEIPYDPIEDWK